MNRMQKGEAFRLIFDNASAHDTVVVDESNGAKCIGCPIFDICARYEIALVCASYIGSSREFRSLTVNGRDTFAENAEMVINMVILHG